MKDYKLKQRNLRASHTFLLHTDDRFVFFATFVTVHEFRFTEKEIHPRLLGMWKRRKVA
jgi:hypothetical protein